MATFTGIKKLSITTVKAVLITPIALGAVVTVQAATLVVPNELANTEGNYNNQFPFGSSLSMRYQQVFAASEFSSLSTSLLITQISFRLDGDDGVAFSATIPNIQINLSTTQSTPDDLSAIFANNVGVNDTVVFNGVLSLESANTGSPGKPKDFDIAINLQNPFLYDPTEGNLLLDVRKFSNTLIMDSSLVPIVLDAQNTVGDSISRRWNLDVNLPTALLPPNGVDDGNPNNFTNSGGLVTEFTFETHTTSAPEPGIAMGVGFFGLIGLLTKKKLASTKL